LISQAEKSGAIPFGACDRKSDLGEAVERFAVPRKAIGHDHDPMGFSVPFAYEDRARRRNKALLVQGGQIFGNDR
jgi:hypothetical protein